MSELAVRFDRRALALNCPVIELWPTADPSHLPDARRNAFDRMCGALSELFGQADTP